MEKQNDNIKVSVIMAVYNTKPFLSQAVESVLNQTFQDFEFLIVDDFSTDWSYEILQDYAQKDNRIKLFRNDKNEGISFTRNKLFSLCSTNYVMTQDSDDVSLPDRMQLEYNFLKNNTDYAAVSWNNEIIDEEWNNIWIRIYSDDISSSILKKSPVSNPSSMMLKSVWEEVWWYMPWLNYAEDYDLRLKMYARWYKIKNLDKTLIKLRIRRGQTKSGKLRQTLKNTIYVQENAIKKYWIKPNLWDRLYIFAEKLALLVPTKFVMFLFKLLNYKKWKK